MNTEDSEELNWKAWLPMEVTDLGMVRARRDEAEKNALSAMERAEVGMDTALSLLQVAKAL